MLDQLTLWMFPGACSRVTMSALEEAGLAYAEVMVNLRSEQQKSPDYLALNPKGKVPTLQVGTRVLTENAAILWLIHQEHPQARLLPHTGDPVQDVQGLIDLCWCTGALHPIVRQIRAPQRVTTGDGQGVREDGTNKMAYECGRMAGRLADQPWWYGADWSIVDVYLYWIYSTAEKGGFALSAYPALVQHAARVRARPSFVRALAREEAAVDLHRAELPAGFAA